MLRIWALFLLCLPAFVSADYSKHERLASFVDGLASEHNFDRDQVMAVFAQAEKKQSILDAISRPAEKRLKWFEYRKIFVTETRIEQGKAFMQTYAEPLARAEQRFGVPAELIAAIIGVETRYGRNKGSYRVVDALATLAFDYPPRSKFFSKELAQVFLLAREQGFDVLDLKGSYAGAMGFGQFIPSSYRHYAIDFDGDGVVDILNNVEDAIGSVANYFVKHKWRSGQPVAVRQDKVVDLPAQFTFKSLKPKHSVAELVSAGLPVMPQLEAAMPAKVQVLDLVEGQEQWLTLHNFYVITRYNHSHMYAMAVYQLSRALAEK